MDAISLDMPRAVTGGGGLIPPVDSRPFARPGDLPQPAPQAPRALNLSHVPAPQRPAVPSYPKPAAWVDKRIALCASHHIRFLAWRKANTARMQAWVEAQPGYDPTQAYVEAYNRRIRAGFLALHGKAA